MCPDSADEPNVIKARAGLFWLEKTETVQDEKIEGDYGLVINGHSLVRGLFHVHYLFQERFNHLQNIFPLPSHFLITEQVSLAETLTHQWDLHFTIRTKILLFLQVYTSN